MSTLIIILSAAVFILALGEILAAVAEFKKPMPQPPLINPEDLKD